MAAACAAASRKPDGVSVIAAAKTFSANAVAAAVAAGLCHVGENYVQEAEEKKAALPVYPCSGIFWGGYKATRRRRWRVFLIGCIV